MRILKTALENVAVEAVAFQPTNFFNELVDLFNQFKKVGADYEEYDFEKEFKTCIQHYTNLQVKMDFKTQFGPAVAIPTINKNNPLVNNIIKNYISNDDGIKMIKGSKNTIRGSVNLKTGKVSGIFSEAICGSEIYFPSWVIISKTFESEELAAMLLHEVGHLFTYYEFIARSATTNQVLAGIARTLDKSDSAAEREAVLISAKKALDLTDSDLDIMLKTTDRKALDLVIITNVIKRAKSEIGTDIYDCNNWEQLADQYAARYGASRYLVSGLSKLYAGNISFRSTGTFYAIEAMKLMMMAMTIVSAAGGLPFTFLAMFLTSVYILMDGPGSPTYDRPGARLRRIRNQLVEQLKSKKLPAHDVKEINNSLILIDKILADVKDRLQFFNVVWGLFSKAQNQRLNAEALQQELERLAANNLFVAAANLNLKD